MKLEHDSDIMMTKEFKYKKDDNSFFYSIDHVAFSDEPKIPFQKLHVQVRSRSFPRFLLACLLFLWQDTLALFSYKYLYSEVCITVYILESVSYVGSIHLRFFDALIHESLMNPSLRRIHTENSYSREHLAWKLRDSLSFPKLPVCRSP